MTDDERNALTQNSPMLEEENHDCSTHTIPKIQDYKSKLRLRPFN